MQSKMTQIEEAWKGGDTRTALRVASTFCKEEPYRTLITRAWSAMNHPAFYEEIGMCPQDVVEAGLSALREKYGFC